VPRALGTAGLALGALACIASSEAGPSITTAAYFVNTTHDSIALSIFRASEPIDCDALAKDPETILQSTAFVTEQCAGATSWKTIPLDLDWDGPDRDEQAPKGPSRECDAVVLRVDGLPDTVVFWSGLPQIDVYEEESMSDDPHALYLERVGDQLFLEPSSQIRIATTSVTLPAGDPCGAR